MAVIALNWELGADLGHVGRFLSIALALRSQGHRPVMLLRDISRAERILGAHGLEYFQAPVWLTPAQGLPPEINFTETLFRFGFLDAEGLAAMIKAWRALWQLIQPDLLVFDHAPTALLAARGLSIPKLITGNSFAVPPRSCPLPRFRWWSESSGELSRLAETEKRATRSANEALLSVGGPPLENIASLYEADVTLICGRPALDVYGKRDLSAYIGPINTLSLGVSPTWPPGEGVKVFAYLKATYPHFEATLKALADNRNGRYIVFAPGAPTATLKRFQSSHITFSALPYRMSDVARECDAGICHAGGVTDIMLEAGKPLLLLPGQMEQAMTSSRVKDLGACVALSLEGNPSDLSKLLKRLMTDPLLREKAQAYSESLASAPNQKESLTLFSSACQGLLNAT